jgi:hypothetical protein
MRRDAIRWLGALCAALTSVAVHAQSADARAADAQRATTASPAARTDPAIVDMDTVVVSGRLPGPGMWKVSKGDHVLYLLGTLSPLPKRMEWIPDDVERTIASAQAVVDPPSLKLDSDIGFFRGVMLLPSLLKARRNPDGKTLQEMVPPRLYAQWTVLKARYIGSDRGVENWRPVFAAQELYEAAMKKSGLSQDDVVQKVVRAAAKAHDVPRIPSAVTYTVKNPKAAIREFNETALADTDCFAKTMARIDGDLENMRLRANAWAVGDIAALRDVPMEDQYAACTRAFTQTALAQKFGVTDIPKRIADAWLASADKALGENRVSFGTLPIPFLLREDGFLARLRAKGYTVVAPGDADEAPRDADNAPNAATSPSPTAPAR